MYQIKETLPKNLNDNVLFKNIIEFVLVDFGSEDGLKDWVLNTFIDELKEGYLAYYYTDELPAWHASIAKNTAHFLASNEILMNLDCDNFTGKYGGKYIIRKFLQHDSNIVIHQFSGDYEDGTYGRIGMQKSLFYNLGGYDESFEPMGFQDTDLMRRAIDMGVQCKNIHNIQYTSSIVNPVSAKVKYCKSALAYEQMNALNLRKSDENRRIGKKIANDGKFGIRKNIFNYQGKEVKQ